jgi:CRISPR-associated protein Cas1
MGALLDAAITVRALRRAWEDVLDNDRDDGVLSPAIAKFADDADTQLELLSEQLADGTFLPRDLTEVSIHDGDDTRTLHIPAVRDRVVERSLLGAITPWVDPVLGFTSFAYRPGLGVADAVQTLVSYRQEGLRWVLRTDVNDCFPSVPVAHARRLLGALVPDADALAIVDLLLDRAAIRPRRGRGVMRGLAQGCALSPLLANLVLVSLDDALVDQGFAVVRYADDVAVAVESREDAWEAARVATGALEVLGMELGADKTEVMSFDEGFCFLGEDFGPRYPPALGNQRVAIPDRRVLYAGIQGGRVRVARGRVVVETPDDVQVLDVPTDHVERVVCFGSVGLTAGARAWAMGNDVDVAFMSRRGSYLGQLLSSSSPTRVRRLRAQLDFTADQARTLPLAVAIVEAKIRKQIVLLQRFGRRTHADLTRDAVSQIRGLLAMLPDCTSTAEAMGMEGAAARVYFPCLGLLFPDGLKFELRSRQPPLDAANSALSYLYTLLTSESVSALVAAGLDPAVGILHAPDEGRPSLALDLVEEFRPLVADQVTLTAARNGELTPASGHSEEGKSGVLLTKAARTSLLAGYELRMLRTTKGALPGYAGTLRRHLYRQAQRLRATIERGEPWTGLSWR